LHDYYNTRVDVIDENSWEFTSNTNNGACQSIDGEWKDWNCKRGDVQFVEWYEKEATMKYSFILNISKYPSWPSPYFMIVLQDLHPSYASESLNNRPITTLKLKNYNGYLYLGHFSNDRLWDWDFHEGFPTSGFQYTNPDWTRGCWGESPTPTDGIHLPENTCHGVYPINRNTNYHVELIISRTGVSFLVDGMVITDEDYKTKSDYTWSRIKFGQYHDANYNTDNDPNLATIYTISDFKRLIKIKD